jgi:hypothetical protein
MAPSPGEWAFVARPAAVNLAAFGHCALGWGVHRRPALILERLDFLAGGRLQA